jgi:serine phosphatase RsbU (regulator of sigma subunit)
LKSTLRIFSWIALIIFSIAGALWLRPYVDLTWQEPLALNANEIAQEAKPILAFLGVDEVLLERNLLIDYSFNTNLVQAYSDSLKIGVNDGLLKKIVDDGQSIVRWEASLLQVKPLQGIDSFSSSAFYQRNGIAQLGFSPMGKVIKMRAKSDAEIGLIQGTSVVAVANQILAQFGYETKDYSLLQNNVLAEVAAPNERNIKADTVAQFSSEAIDLVWNNASPSQGKPSLLRMTLVPSLEEDSINTKSTTINSGFKLTSFDSQLPVKTVIDTTIGNDTLGILLFLGCSFFLLIMVFISGLIPVIKGRVDWRKALFIFLMVAAALVFWRAQFVWRIGSTALGLTDILLSFTNYYFLSALIALYGAMAFIGWNNLAHDFDHAEFRLVNEFWFYRFKFRESGLAAVQGIGIGFALVSVTLLALKMANVYMYNSEGVNYGVTEPESFFPPLTIAASAWSIAWLAALGQIGVVTDLLQKWLKNIWAAVGISVVLNSVIGVFFIRMFGTNAELGIDFLTFLPISLILVLTYKRFGIVTLSIALFTYTVLINLFPFMQPGVGIGPASTAVLLISALTMLFAVAVYLYKTAPSVEEEVELLPEYELRYQTQERVVREIEIARQSQMQLMPTIPPQVEGVDLYGFFMPSFEVGGDYYYYYKLPREGEEQLAFTVLDVSGKAMRAAIQAVFTSGLIMSRMNTDPPDDILDAISPLVHAHTDNKTFITCIVGRYDAKLRSLNFANAGHCMPLLKRGDTAKFLETSAPKFPLGMKKTVDYKARTIQLEIGDVLLLYSDGFPEAENRKRDRIGFDGVKEMMAKMDTQNLTAREIGEKIKKRIVAHSGQQLADDTTAIVMKIVG